MNDHWGLQGKADWHGIFQTRCWRFLSLKDVGLGYPDSKELGYQAGYLATGGRVGRAAE